MTDRLTPQDVGAFTARLAELRIGVTLSCACRCSCHGGRCAGVIDPTTDNGLDCDAGCRGLNYLDAACTLDQMARHLTPSSSAQGPS